MVDRIGSGAGARPPEHPAGLGGPAAADGRTDARATQQPSNPGLRKFQASSVTPAVSAPRFSVGKDLAKTSDILNEKARSVRSLDDVRALIGQRTLTPSGPTIGSVPHSQQITLLQTAGLFTRFIEPAADRIKVMREILDATRAMPETEDRGPVLKLLPHMIKELEPRHQEEAFRLLSEDLNVAMRKDLIENADYFEGLGGLTQVFEKTSPEFQAANIDKLLANMAKLPPHQHAESLRLLGMKRFLLSDETEPQVSRAIVLAWGSDRFNDKHRATITDGLVSGIATLRSADAADAAVMSLLDAAEALPELEKRKGFAQLLEPHMPSDENQQAYAALVQNFDNKFEAALNNPSLMKRYQELQNLAGQMRDLSNADTNGPLTNDRYVRYRQLCDVLLPVMRPHIKANRAVPAQIWQINITLHNARDLLSPEENAAINAAIEAADLQPETR